MDPAVMQRAEILLQALPYYRRYAGKIVVIKYGGNAMVNPGLLQQVMGDIVYLSQVGIRVVLVHGGGPDITQMLTRLAIPSAFQDGLRVTDGETMEIVQQVLAGKINKDLVKALQLQQGRAIGLAGMDGGMIRAKQLHPGLGFVGEIVSVDAQPILGMLACGYIPVIATVGCDDAGNTYNINADTAAARIAGSLQAESFICMTDINGLLRDVGDPTSLIASIRQKAARDMLQSGQIQGGMIPKVQCCLDALQHGVRRVFIINGTVPHAILIELLTDAGIGTMFLPNEQKGEEA